MHNSNQRILLGVGLAIASFMLIITSGAIDAVFWFFFAGVVPGTDFVVPATYMLVGYLALTIVIVRTAIQKELYPGSPTVVKAHREANKEARKDISRKIALERRKEIRKKTHIAATTQRKQKYSRVSGF